MESDMDFYRCSSLYGVDNLLFGKYLLMTEQLRGKEYYIKIEGASAKVNLKKEEAVVSYDREIDDDDLKKAVEEAGFKVVDIRA